MWFWRSGADKLGMKSMQGKCWATRAMPNISTRFTPNDTNTPAALPCTPHRTPRAGHQSDILQVPVQRPH